MNSMYNLNQNNKDLNAENIRKTEFLILKYNNEKVAL